jgi:hypothetical protein
MSTEKHLIGTASEFLVAYYLASTGNDVFIAQGNSRADLVYVKDGKPVLVQVKTGTKVKTGTFVYEQVRLRTRGVFDVSKQSYKNYGPYEDGEVDELWVVGTHLWNFPPAVFVGKNSLALGTSSGKKSRKDKLYDPDSYIVVRGEWERPIRDILCHYT